jgi:hypothetical protein
MDDGETLAAPRALHPDIPVVLSSGYDEAQVMQGYHLERPQAFMPEPYRMKDLKAALGMALKTSPPGRGEVPRNCFLSDFHGTIPDS